MNVVITHLLTSAPDPQRGEQWPSDTPIDLLHRSLVDCELVVLHDRYPTPTVTLADDLVPVEFVQVEPGDNPYQWRWWLTLDWLNSHTDVGWVWVVDALDVQMRRPPWLHMQPGRLYVGSEFQVVGNQWLAVTHPGRRAFIEQNARRVLLNSGIVGGDSSTVRRFVEQIAVGIRPDDAFCMGSFNETAWTRWADRLETGHPVHSVFKAYDDDNRDVWWIHK